MKTSGNMGKFYYYAFPMQAVLVTCNDEKGKTNIITVAWHAPISKSPALYGISVAPSRYSHELIEKTKEFVVNFVPFELLDKLHLCGKKSGRNINKIDETGLTLIPGEKVKTPIIKECYAHLECKLYKTEVLGDHTFFIGEVVNLLADQDAFTDDLLNNKKIRPIYYIGGNVYTTVDKTSKNLS
jgi:flavin reductase (DIM6/NTAB) family NADH-FMN oxidoreductase RutF